MGHVLRVHISKQGGVLLHATFTFSVMNTDTEIVVKLLVGLELESLPTF